MKKFFYLIVAIFVFMSAIVNVANAQSLRPSFLVDTKTMEKALSFYEPVFSVDEKAMRDFKRNYPYVDSEKWFTLEDGLMASFTTDGIQHLAYYSKNGNWQYTVLYYSEAKFPVEVKDLVKRAYNNYAITGVEELHSLEQTIFMVHIQDVSTVKKIMVSDGEMRVMEEYAKN